MAENSKFVFDEMSQEIVPAESELREMTHFERQQKFEEIFRGILPHLGSHIGKSVMVQTLITLKLEGLLGDQLTESDLKMVRAVQESVMNDKDRRAEAIRFSQRLLD